MIPKPEPLRRHRARLRRVRMSHEVAEKIAVRERDLARCRWPWCGTTREVEVAHLEHKGMGGDPQQARTQQAKMLCLCARHHRGSVSLDAKRLRVVPLTDAGTDGPCRFQQQVKDGRWMTVAQETAVGRIEERE